MRKELLEAIALREERVSFAGATLVVRELPSAASLGQDREDAQTDFFWKMMVECVFEEDGQTPALTRDDIPNLKSGSRSALAPLILAVTRVNGLDLEGDAKKSPGVPGSDSSTVSP